MDINGKTKFSKRIIFFCMLCLCGPVNNVFSVTIQNSCPRKYLAIIWAEFDAIWIDIPKFGLP